MATTFPSTAPREKSWCLGRPCGRKLMSNSLQELTRWGPFGRLVAWWRGGSKEKRRSERASHRKMKAHREDFVNMPFNARQLPRPTVMPRRCTGPPTSCFGLIFTSELGASHSRRRVGPTDPYSEWDGSDLAGLTFSVRAYTPRDRVGEELRLSTFIAPAAKQARRCIVLGERRILPLAAQLRWDRGPSAGDRRRRGPCRGGRCRLLQTIALHTVKTAEDMRRAFVPLRADPKRVASIRQRYHAESRGPLLGISWGSSNPDKLLPDLKSWVPLLGWGVGNVRFAAIWRIQKDLETLRELTGGRVIHDTEMNQLVDLDGFAAQITALDGVISISNTTIDMAGMLGVPTVHIRDDNFSSAIWPRSGPSPWYPNMIFLYRGRRPWSEVFAEARTRLEQRSRREADALTPTHRQRKDAPPWVVSSQVSHGPSPFAIGLMLGASRRSASVLNNALAAVRLV